MKNILITGANGLLGREVAHHCLEHGFQVFGLVRVMPDSSINGVRYVVADLAVEWSVANLPKQVDIIVHLAQSPRFRDFPAEAADVFMVNIQSTARLLDYAYRSAVAHFIFASSGGVYANGIGAFRENSPIVTPGQLGYYLGSKMCGEILVQSYVGQFTVTVLRPFFIYGPGQNRTMLIPRLFDNIAAGRPIRLQGDSGIRVNPIHVKDAATAVVAAIRNQVSTVFNIAGPEILSLRNICEGMGHYIGRSPIFESNSGEPQDLIADIRAMRKHLHVPQYRLLDSLDDVAFYYR